MGYRLPTFTVGLRPGEYTGSEPSQVDVDPGDTVVIVPPGALAVVVDGAGQLLHPELQAMAVIDAVLEHAPSLAGDKAACARVAAWVADRWEPA